MGRTFEVGQGVNAVAQVLRSGDAAVRDVDGALTGGAGRPQQSPLPNAPSEEQVTHQVADLVRQARDEVARSGDPAAPGVMARFREAMRLLFHLPLPAAGLSDIMPSPMEAARVGVRELRGSMALVRLANGTGSLADVEEVARFAEEVADPQVKEWTEEFAQGKITESTWVSRLTDTPPAATEAVEALPFVNDGPPVAICLSQSPFG